MMGHLPAREEELRTVEEDVLEVYTRPSDEQHPLVCMDETTKQLVGETQAPMLMAPGRAERYAYEYVRPGVANLFLLFEPLQGKRHVKVTDHRTRADWAGLMRELVDVHYPRAETLTVLLDNLNTHSLASLYETFEPQEARRIARKLDLHHTPKHGSWLNMAEIELSVLSRQCLLGAWRIKRCCNAKWPPGNDSATAWERWPIGALPPTMHVSS